MAEKDWVTVLRAVYEEDLMWLRGSGAVQTGPIEGETGLDEETVQDALSFLAQAGLVGEISVGEQATIPRTSMEEFDPDWDTLTTVGLTPKGFEVMHERETNRYRHQTNYALVVLTLGLFVASMIQAAVQLYSTSTAQAVSAGVLVVTVLFLVALWRFDWGP